MARIYHTISNNTGKKKKKKSNGLQSYIMLSPQIFGFLVFSIYPLIWAMKQSFYFYNTIQSQTRFVGLENFRILFGDANYWKSFGNTLLFAAMKIPIELSIALLLAVLLNAKFRGRGFFRAMFYLPHVVSTAIIALIFSNIFSYFGVVNSALTQWGVLDNSVDWFGTKMKAMWILVIADIWKSLGVNILYFLAALQNVPEEVYESAKLDGASSWVVFTQITIPMIAPVLKTIIMLSIVGTLGINELVVVLTNGAPSGSTFTVKSYIFSNYAPGMADVGVNVGYGCAMSLVTGILLALITAVYRRLSKKLGEQ